VYGKTYVKQSAKMNDNDTTTRCGGRESTMPGNKNFVRDALFPDCPIRNVLARISGKWAMLILFTLNASGGKAVRFKQLERGIPDISQKMLTSVLRTLEADGLVSRTVFPEIPPRVEYNLTPLAHSLLPLIENLVEWATNNMRQIIGTREQYLIR